MFKHLIGQSPDCENPVTLRLDEVIKASKRLDEQQQNNSSSSSTYSIPPAGFVFHESRCGSTLVANSLVAVSPSQHRVYSESAPLIYAMKLTSDDPSPAGIEFMQNIVYLMGRTTNTNTNSENSETKLFYKIQSIGTTHARGLLRAFPEIPWIFVYRDPVQVMMSHMPKDVDQAVCLRSRRHPPQGLVQLVKERSARDFRSLSSFESCAAHLVRRVLFFNLCI